MRVNPITGTYGATVLHPRIMLHPEGNIVCTPEHDFVVSCCYLDVLLERIHQETCSGFNFLFHGFIVFLSLSSTLEPYFSSGIGDMNLTTDMVGDMDFVSSLVISFPDFDYRKFTTRKRSADSFLRISFTSRELSYKISTIV